MSSPCITLLTDFGTTDHYVGIMKGVMQTICPGAQLIDLTHAIPPQHIIAAALTLQQAAPYFPAGTVHLVVVDPGVGSQRRPIAIQTPHASLVGPDNGVLFPFWQAARQHWPDDQAVLAVHLTEPRFWLPQISTTFHGRDIFAPVAAHLAYGVPLTELGPLVSDLVPLTIPQPHWQPEDNTLYGQVQSIDHFGNCITNITADHLLPLGDPTNLHITWEHGGQTDSNSTHLATTYAAVAPGDVLALMGSSHLLEIAIRNGNAAQTLGLTIGSQIRIAAKSESRPG
ncbi:MAG: SAM-dependent chlorinase/fluorinase [Chloroflexaceae bacterium]|nr:SAM-dependent chlorinase/fluorinase [Chloroflexaceae bacterium]